MAKYKKEDGFREVDLMQFAEDHLNTGYSLLAYGVFTAYDSAAYLIHLAFELFLKAWILHLKGGFNNQHDLMKLLDTLGIVKQFSDEELTTFQKIQSFYDSRYPKPTPSEPIGTNDWNSVEKLVKKLFELFPNTLKDEYEKIVPATKGGRVVSSSKMLKIQEAAKYLGKTTQTLRNWDKSGKLRPLRYGNNYRVYPMALLKHYKITNRL